MKRLWKTLKNKSGFISIETLIVAGLMIGLGVYIISQWYQIEDTVIEDALENINEVLDLNIIGQPIQ